MHELGITRNIVSIVSEHAAGKPVTRVTVEIGKLSAVMPDAVRFCFDVCTEGTCLEGAELEILEIDGRGECLQCGASVALATLYATCRCGSTRIRCVAGEELSVKQMEVA
ncbi:MAG: hydrogenase maturation nickel metallochaperone HypA [Arenicellales bacterium]